MPKPCQIFAKSLTKFNPTTDPVVYSTNTILSDLAEWSTLGKTQLFYYHPHPKDGEGVFTGVCLLTGGTPWPLVPGPFLGSTPDLWGTPVRPVAKGVGVATDCNPGRHPGATPLPDWIRRGRSLLWSCRSTVLYLVLFSLCLKNCKQVKTSIKPCNFLMPQRLWDNYGQNHVLCKDEQIYLYIISINNTIVSNR